MEKVNLAIFVSGSGSNCENLIKYFADSNSVNCALVVSNKPDAYALVRARNLGVQTAVVTKAELNDAEVMLPLLRQYGIQFIASGYYAAGINYKERVFRNSAVIFGHYTYNRLVLYTLTVIR